MILVLYVFNSAIDIMEIDAAQYASISSEMNRTGQYLQVYMRGQDYLDKPPLLFWLSSMSIAVFGNSNIGYKLPSILLLIIALWATYKFSRLWYDHKTGVLAALMLGTCQAFFLMTNDVRTDGLLTAFVILSVWQLSLFLKQGNIFRLLTGGLCIGFAMLAKGPLGLFIPTLAIGGHLLLSAQWKKLFDPVWLLVLIPIIIVLAPMCYGLYMQFDMHPEKEVYGLKGPSGLGFYFWTQSFGRITGESTWNNNAPIYYFIQTLLWDLQPWVLLFIPAIWFKLKQLWKKQSRTRLINEWITLCGFIIPFIALSFSKYKLPHYIFPLFPFAIIITADFINRHIEKLKPWVEYFQLLIVHLLVIAAALILFWVFPVTTFWLPVICILLLFILWWWRKQLKDKAERWVFPSITGIIIFQLVMSLHFYPQLLLYQSSSQAGKLIKEEKPERVYWHDQFGYGLDYYSDMIVPQFKSASIESLPPGTWMYVSDNALDTVGPHTIIREFEDFRVSRLSYSFLNPEKRKEKVKKMYIIELKR